MPPIGRLVGAELLKARTTRTTYGLLAGYLLLLVLILALTLGNAKTRDLQGGDIRNVLSLAGGLGYFFTLSLGIIGMAGEYRHGTMGHALLAAPQRWPVVVSKLSAYTLLGLGFGLVGVLVTYGIAAPWASSKDAGFSLSDTLPLRILLGSIGACALFCALGVALGALLKDQVLALSVGIGWTLLVDGLVSGVAPEVGKWFPGGALAALVRSRTEDVLPIGGGLLLLLAYVAIFAAVGTELTRRRDLT